MKGIIAAAVGFVTLTAGTGGAVEAGPAPGDAEEAFSEWAAANGVPVTQPACITASEVVCYGLAEDRRSVVVGYGTADVSGVVLFGGPVVLPAETPGSQPAVTPNSQPSGASDLMTSFGAGTWLVGVDIAPGVYRTEGGDSCYWKRLSGLGGSSDEVIASDVLDGPVVVEVQQTDVAFQVDEDCGTWTLLP